MSRSVPYFEDVLAIYNSESLSLKEKYPKLRGVLEQACRELTKNEPNQFKDLFSRQSYLVDKYALDRSVIYWLNGLRITANNVLHNGTEPSIDNYRFHLKGLCDALAHFFSTEIPLFVKEVLPSMYPPPPQKKFETLIPQLRCIVQEVKDNSIMCKRDDGEDDLVEILVNVIDTNDTFRDSVEKIKPGMELLLWKVEATTDNKFIPEFIIVEPDFLIDASSLAECFKAQGDSPLHYLLDKFKPKESSTSLLIGNLANQFVDEIMNENGTPITFEQTLLKGFKQASIEFTNNESLQDRNEFNKFLANAKQHFNNIRRVIQHDFAVQADLPIDPAKCVLEPAFVSDKFGLQGRLDILEIKKEKEPKANVIELKSGKLPFRRKIAENHERQLMVYELLLQSALNISYKNIKTRLLYSTASEENLRVGSFSFKQKQELLNLRNLIAIMEYNIANDLSDTFDITKKYLDAINETNLITRTLHPNFLPYAQKDIHAFTRPLSTIDDIERAYFYAYTNFIAREAYLSKCGDGSDTNSSVGLASLWKVSFDEKKERCEILYDLTIELDSNCCDSKEKTIKFRRTQLENKNANFRVGDVVILYPRKKDNYLATNDQVFKCTIKDINKDYVTIQLRNQQKNKDFFDSFDFWGIEKDFIDGSFSLMTRSLFEFIKSDPYKRKLLLGREAPEQYTFIPRKYSKLSVEQSTIIQQALQSKDYFLIVGPPGTGKTSIVLKTITKELLRENKNILVIAYTNRAVDEICEKIDMAAKELLNEGVPISTKEHHYIRIGSELSTEPSLRNCLLERQIQSIMDAKEAAGGKLKREDIRHLFEQHRIVVSTLTSICNKAEIFDLKQFDTIIVDEASQILEPQLIGILTKARKFILIGDHKQLPAIVLQDEGKAKVNHPDLHSIGLYTRSNSLFERLHDTAISKAWKWAYAELTHQGRMHEDLLLFPNHSFYESKLQLSEEPTRLSEQSSLLNLLPHNFDSGMERHLCANRLLFVPSELNRNAEVKQVKTNEDEAVAIVKLIEKVILIYQANNRPFHPSTTLGVITPYRNQIAVIKDKIEESPIITAIADYQSIMVDTVERYQGSQRDVILVSFCVSSLQQLNFLTANTRTFKTEEGYTYNIDRKLNVTLTRAKEQLIITGVEPILSNNIHYYRLIQYIKSKGGYIKEGAKGVMADKIEYENDFEELSIDTKIYTPSDAFKRTFNHLVADKLKYDQRTITFPELILGISKDQNRSNLISYGRANFEEEITINGKVFSPTDRAKVYCYFNMRKHYCTAMAVWESLYPKLRKEIENCSGRLHLIDIGCGPLTSSLALNEVLINNSYLPGFTTWGIDKAPAMLEKAKEFYESGLLNKGSKLYTFDDIASISADALYDQWQQPSLVIFNLSYLFGSIDEEQAVAIASTIDNISSSYSFNRYFIICQHSSVEKNNSAYKQFKRQVTNFKKTLFSGTKKVGFKNTSGSKYDNEETVYYEVLER